MFGDNTIYKRVWEVLKTKIKDLEARYKEGCVKIDEEAEAKKVALQDSLVNEVLGKIL